MFLQKLKARVQRQPPPAHPERLLFVMTGLFLLLGLLAGFLLPLFQKEMPSPGRMAGYGGFWGFCVEFVALGTLLLSPRGRWRMFVGHGLVTLPLLLIFSAVFVRQVFAALERDMDSLERIVRVGRIGASIGIAAVGFPAFCGWWRWAMGTPPAAQPGPELGGQREGGQPS